jgi:hypothetical protein
VDKVYGVVNEIRYGDVVLLMKYDTVMLPEHSTVGALDALPLVGTTVDGTY